MQKIKWDIPTCLLYRVLNIAGLLLLAGLVLYIALAWKALPEQVPSHYGLSGEADAWKGKNAVLFCPIVGILVYALIAVVERFPSLWNTGVTLTAENAMPVLFLLKGMLTFLKFTIALGFSYIGYCTAAARSLGFWFLPVFLLLLFVPMAFYTLRVYRLR